MTHTKKLTYLQYHFLNEITFFAATTISDIVKIYILDKGCSGFRLFFFFFMFIKKY